MKRKSYFKYILATIGFFACSSCKKLVEIPEPVDTITATETFSTTATATSALINLYSLLSYDGDFLSFSNGGLSLEAGQSADEFQVFDGTYLEAVAFETNSLQATNSFFYNIYWSQAYRVIYGANAIVEGAKASATLPATTKNQITGEAKFLRAFSYFYLVNLFGDVPLVTSTDFNQTKLLSRTPSAQVYQQIVSDLQDAQNLLPDDFSAGAGERIRANKSAATALLARVYLYIKNYSGAITQSSLVINNKSNYSLVPNLSHVFDKNSTEAILQWQVSNNLSPYATIEANSNIPPDTLTNPTYYCTSSLLSAFDAKDKRRMVWIDSINYSGTIYYYPYKYTIYQGNPGANVPQYYMVLRLAEQYLIRAEANAQQTGGNLSQAIADLNMIRNRSGLSNTNATSQTAVLSAIYHERQIELFGEWGHRWLDLKRTGQALSILSQIPYKTGLNTNQLLYPIPLKELQSDPNLVQNPGY